MARQASDAARHGESDESVIPSNDDGDAPAGTSGIQVESHPCHSDAILLNNLGVERLEQHSYEEALQYFADATLLMNIATASTSSGSDSNAGQFTWTDIDSGSDQTAATQADQPITEEVKSPSRSGSMIFEMITIDCQDRDNANCSENLLDQVLGVVPSSCSSILIRIEEMDGQTSLSPEAVLRHGAILSHNHAVACICHSRMMVGRDGNTMDKSLASDAVKLSLTAFSVLVRLQYHSLRETRLSLKWHCVAMIVLNTLITGLRETNQADHADHFYNFLVHLRSLACHIEDTLDRSQRESVS